MVVTLLFLIAAAKNFERREISTDENEQEQRRRQEKGIRATWGDRQDGYSEVRRFELADRRVRAI